MSAFSLEILNVTQCPFVNRKMGCLGTLKFLRNKISFEYDITCYIYYVTLEVKCLNTVNPTRDRKQLETMRGFLYIKRYFTFNFKKNMI